MKNEMKTEVDGNLQTWRFRNVTHFPSIAFLSFNIGWVVINYILGAINEMPSLKLKENQLALLNKKRFHKSIKQSRLKLLKYKPGSTRGPELKPSTKIRLLS